MKVIERAFRAYRLYPSARLFPCLPMAGKFPIGAMMDVTDLRVAIFSGNYNYVRDGRTRHSTGGRLSAASGASVRTIPRR